MATAVDDRSGGTTREDAGRSAGRRYRPDVPAARWILGQTDTAGQRIERIVPVDDAVSSNDHDSESRRVGPERFADRPRRHHLEIVLASERVPMIVTGEHISHAGVTEQFHYITAFGDGQVVVLIRLANGGEEPRMMLKHDDAALRRSRVADRLVEPSLLRRRFVRREIRFLEQR